MVDTERGDTARAYTARRIDMAWTDPKVDWASDNGVGYADMNEIGTNLVYLKTHADATSGVHGGVAIATPSTFMVRDAAGRSKVVEPSAETDIALKSNVTAEAAARVVADGLQDVTIAGLGTDKVAIAGDTMTGQLIGHGADTDYTTVQFRGIVLRTTVPTAGQIENGEIAMVYDA